MKLKTSYIIIGIFTAIIIFYIYLYSQPGKYDAFAQCLTEKEAKMYGVDSCHFCQQQKQMFGKSFKYIEYVQCDKTPSTAQCVYPTSPCGDICIRGTPTWLINGEQQTGMKELSTLSSLSGCPLR